MAAHAGNMKLNLITSQGSHPKTQRTCALNLIKSNPRLSPVSLRVTGSRQLRVGKLLLFYRVHEEHIEIVSVRHGAQQF